jgi:hypothetical protein
MVAAMRNPPETLRETAALSLKIGRWAEARATGWGVVALVILAALLAAVVLSGRTLLGH